ncbi:PHA/PHB synthase family protein [Chelativorans salis]|uniref:Class I poly(R)-hydroxyalkanoic acid synthase n=1 Tax=Chelativorans salis TaxID=2978478 RepID=A0ABT2LQS6_9HYPH|nr:class I poly(R)-hydroxyalkanoic acid synthase [Chelativorans sp. EGI FJ00035]MCT7375723.1 class I poly(R)-hydroxyalkanoic acid synthase [Chelativorans sp. EGI FJ00035]
MVQSGNQNKRETDGGTSLESYTVRDPERFALNLARALEEAGKAAAAWSRPREAGEKPDTMAEPLADMVKTFSKLTEYWMSDPARALEAQTRLFSSYMGIWANSIRRMSGEPAEGEPVEPEAGDKRFQDPDWATHAFFDFLKQAYLVTSRWASDLVENAEGLDEQSRHKARFYVRQVSEALSPTNFIMTNPQLLRETFESDGENLVRGMRMLAEDIAAGKGELRLRQSDYSKFELGRNLATTPGKVVARSDLAEIIQYAPASQTVLRRPLLIVPPWINKFYVLDLNPERSFIRWAVEQGHTVFVVSWVNPDERHGNKGWDEYFREGIEFGLDTIAERTGERQVNVLGYCVGGTLLAASLALMAQETDDRIASATLLTTQVDFTHAGDLKVFADEEQVEAIDRAMKEKGYLEGSRMATAFNMLRARDLIWPYVVNNYLRGRDPLPFDLLYWNADSTRMAAANHSYYLRNCYLENNLAKGRATLCGKRLSLAEVKVPVYNLATIEDHIAPAKSVFTGSRLFGGPVEFVLAGSGHIAGVVNPPGLNKYQHWIGGALGESLEGWLETAQAAAGSWWPHWQAWIEKLDDTRVPARKLDRRKKMLGEAPGEYVRARV